MALRHILMRLTPRFGRGWLILLLVVALVAVGVSYLRWDEPPPPLDLVALGPDGRFHDTLRVPVDWGDTATRTPDAVTRVPLILGVRNLGTQPVHPTRLSLSLPLRFRLTAAGGRPIDVDRQPGSPLITYVLETGGVELEPGRLPALLPRHDTLWLEVVIPTVYCVAVGDSIPEFGPAPPPPLAALSDVRLFYSFEGGDLSDRRTGTLSVRIDTTLLRVDIPDAPPVFEMVHDPVAARPPLGSLRREGSRRALCGEPEAPLAILSTVWATADGGRFITLDYGGTVRKRLYDLDGDGVIERESWDPTGTGAFTATRQARFPIPEFLLPLNASVPDLAGRESSDPDDPLPPPPSDRDGSDGPAAAAVDAPPGDSLPALPEPTIDRGILGNPATPPRPDSGGG
jgi:hypothetical protein